MSIDVGPKAGTCKGFMVVGVCVPSSNFLYICETCFGGGCFGTEGGLGGSGGDFIAVAVTVDSGGVGGNVEVFRIGFVSCIGDSGVGCILKGLVLPAAFGVTGDIPDVEGAGWTRASVGGGNRFFFAAASRRLVSFELSSLSGKPFAVDVPEPRLVVVKNGLEEADGIGLVKTSGCV